MIPQNIHDLHFVLFFFIPGFIYIGVLSNFVPIYRESDKPTIFMKYIIATAIIYMVSSPLIYLLIANNNIIFKYLLLFVILFIIPTILSVVRAYTIQYGTIKKICDKCHLRIINPIPTGWDWKFSRINSCFVIITLKDGSEIGGLFGENSMASSDANQRDIYVEKVYKIIKDGPWEEVENSQGIYVYQDQIAYVEFLG